MEKQAWRFFGNYLIITITEIFKMNLQVLRRDLRIRDGGVRRGRRYRIQNLQKSNHYEENDCDSA
jgi:hypothetical protein